MTTENVAFLQRREKDVTSHRINSGASPTSKNTRQILRCRKVTSHFAKTLKKILARSCCFVVSLGEKTCAVACNKHVMTFIRRGGRRGGTARTHTHTHTHDFEATFCRRFASVVYRGPRNSVHVIPRSVDDAIKAPTGLSGIIRIAIIRAKAMRKLSIES
jgi:hypothetical protein